MKKLLLAFLLFGGAVCTAAQNPVPSASPTPVATDDEVVKISTNLIRLDVSVTDPDGKVVRDLKPEDFEVFENGKKQQVTTFSFVSSVREKATEERPAKNAPQPVPTPPAEMRPEDVRRAVALVIDDFSLSFESTYQVRRALRKYVDEQMREGDLVAIIRAKAGVGALQQFTSDKRVLYAAIEKIRWYPLSTNRLGAFDPANDSMNIPEEDKESQELRKNAENDFADFQSSTFASGTFGALRYVVRGMSELPGRKSVILFSEGFSLTTRTTNGWTAPSSIIDVLRRLIDLANRNSVVFYTVDTRGVEPAGYSAEDNVSVNGGNALIGPRRSQLVDTQQGLSFLARETGGFAVINNNDISKGIRRVFEDQSYYLVGYEPDSDTFDSKRLQYNRVVIKVRGRDDLRVRYRSGFLNVADKKAPSVETGTPMAQIMRALASPFGMNDVELRLNALFGNSKAGSFVRAIVHIDASEITFVEDADGRLKSEFQIAAVTFDANGSPVDQKIQSYAVKISKENLESQRRSGYIYSLQLPVKKPGAYQFRVALRDSIGGKLGSASQYIEVPNLKNDRLTVSGIVLEGLTEDQFRQLDAGKPIAASADGALPDSFEDTSLRRFARGTVLRYGFDVYNAGASKQSKLTSQVRVFREGKLVFEGRPQEVNLAGQADPERPNVVGAISLARQMDPGDYVMQVVVTDGPAKEKGNVAVQFVQFQLTADGR